MRTKIKRDEVHESVRCGTLDGPRARIQGLSQSRRKTLQLDLGRLEYGGPSTIDKMQRRVQYDVDFLKNWSLWLDLNIMARTALTVAYDRNAY